MNYTQAVCVDLAKTQPKAATATVLGVIDGTGALGAAVGQQIVAYASDKYGWEYVFYVLVVSLLIRCVLALGDTCCLIRRSVFRHCLASVCGIYRESHFQRTEPPGSGSATLIAPMALRDMKVLQSAKQAGGKSSTRFLCLQLSQAQQH